MGSDVFVYFTLESEVERQRELEELAADSGRADTGATATRSSPGSTPPRRSREGQDAELWADLRSIHVFDPARRQNLTLDDGTDRPGPALRHPPAADTGRGRRPDTASTDAPGRDGRHLSSCRSR